MNRRCPFCLMVMLVFLLSAYCLLPAVFAQSATATLLGTVVDQNGAIVPGVAITVINTATGLQWTATTNEHGDFVIPLLPPRTYTVRVQRDGFAPVQVPNVVLNVGDQKSLQIQLKTGDINATVQVVSEAPLINESPAVGTVVDRQFVSNLPLNGRSFQSLITLTPGIVLAKSTISDQGQFSANGQRADANYFLVDGVSANIGVTPGTTAGQAIAGTLPGLSAFGSTSNLVSVDAVQEFKVLTSSFAPEFGRMPGAQVSVVTRSGTNQFRGSFFEYFRNDALDASDWFANSRGKKKAALRQNDFGGVLGGPIIKNKTFFFFSYEGLRLRLPLTAITAVPSLSARQQAEIQVPQILPFLNAFPIPNGKDLGSNFTEFNATYSDPSSLNATSIRLDHTVNSRLTLFGRYNYSPSDTSQRGVGRSVNGMAVSRFNTQTLTSGATLAISTTVDNDFRFNYSRNRGAVSNPMDDFGGAKPIPDSTLFPNLQSSQGGFFRFTLTGVNSTALQVGGTSIFNLQRQINLVDTLAIITGSHQLKVGVDYRRLFPVFDSAHYVQSAVFAGVNGALTGKASSVSISAFAGPIFPVFTNFSLFGQDTWRVKARLTFTYGLRWEVNPSPSAARGKQPFAVSGLSDLSTLAFAPPGTPLYETTHNNFAPRVGMAYQFSQAKGRETVLRAGFGIFYDVGTGTAAGQFGTAFPNSVSNTLTAPGGVTFPLDPASAAPPALNLNPPFGFVSGVIDPKLKLPYTYQWNIAAEHSLGTNQTLSASYVGAIGRRLLRQELIQAPNPLFSSSVVITRNTATSDYHAMQVQFQRRLSRSLQALASYTWSHSIDNESSELTFGAPRGRIDLSLERGSSNFDVRHAFTAATTYELPAPSRNKFANVLLREFSLDTIFAARTATPVNVTTGTSAVGGFAGSLSVSRPDLILGVPLYISDSTVGGGKRINKAAFSIPVGRQGSLGRNALRGFPMCQLNLSLRRQFNLTERVTLDLRADFFNIFNHPNFGDPGAGGNGTNALTSPQFGQSTNILSQSLGSGGSGFNPLYQVGGPRSVQLALKLGF